MLPIPVQAQRQLLAAPLTLPGRSNLTTRRGPGMRTQRWAAHAAQLATSRRDLQADSRAGAQSDGLLAVTQSDIEVSVAQQQLTQVNVQPVPLGRCEWWRGCVVRMHEHCDAAAAKRRSLRAHVVQQLLELLSLLRRPQPQLCARLQERAAR